MLLQPLLWMWLHDNPRINFPERAKHLFWLGAVWAAVAVYVTGFTVGYYRSHLLIQYIALTVVAVAVFNVRRCFKEAVCLGFLAVFLNSFYWEVPLHFAALLSGESLANLLVQGWRLAPAVFLLRRYEFGRYARPTLEVGLIVSAVVMLLNFYVFRGQARAVLYAVNRLICLFLLVKVIIESNHKLKEADVEKSPCVRVADYVNGS